MKNYGYGSYRGRSRLRSFLKGVIILLLAVLLLAIAALIFLQRYMVFSDDGVRFELPFFQNSSPAPTPTSDPGPSATPDLVVIVSPTPTQDLPPEEQVLHAVELPQQALYDGTAADLVASAGGNAAVFDMKRIDGSLGYVSALQLAKDVRASASDPALNSAIQALTSGELYTIARVSCFRDNALPYYRNDLALRSGGGNWKDDQRIRWSNPVHQEVRSYLTAVCVELAQLGFDEILLDNAAYPARGNTGNIKVGENYDPAALDDTVNAFYQEVAQALEEYDVTLSIATSAAVLDGTDSLSGQSSADLVRCAGRLWLLEAQGDTDYTGALARAGLDKPATRFVPAVSAPGSEDTSWVYFLIEP